VQSPEIFFVLCEIDIPALWTFFVITGAKEAVITEITIKLINNSISEKPFIF